MLALQRLVSDAFQASVLSILRRIRNPQISVAARTKRFSLLMPVVHIVTIAL